MTDDIDRSFDWYTAALRGERGQIDADNPKAGYYRTRAARGSKDFIPVAFWYDSTSGDLRCHRAGKDVSDMPARELWPHASKNPVTSFAYWAKIETGQWPDNDTAADAIAQGPEIDPVADPVGSLKAEIEKAVAGVPAYKSIDSDEAAAKGQTLRSALTGLAGKADKARAIEKEPSLEEGRKIDAKYMPLVKLAKSGADTIRTALANWEDFKRAAAWRAKAEADRKAAEHAEAVRKAEEANQPPPPPPPAPVASNAPAPAAQIKGGSGRTAHVGIKKVVTAIDIDKAFKHFRAAPELYAFLLDLSQKAANAGITVDGAVIEEKSDVR